MMEPSDFSEFFLTDGTSNYMCENRGTQLCAYTECKILTTMDGDCRIITACLKKNCPNIGGESE